MSSELCRLGKAHGRKNAFGKSLFVKSSLQPFLPEVNIQNSFSREGKTIAESSKYSFEVEGASRTIIIKGASVEDIGKYTCVAENVRLVTIFYILTVKNRHHMKSRD